MANRMRIGRDGDDGSQAGRGREFGRLGTTTAGKETGIKPRRRQTGYAALWMAADGDGSRASFEDFREFRYGGLWWVIPNPQESLTYPAPLGCHTESARIVDVSSPAGVSHRATENNRELLAFLCVSVPLCETSAVLLTATDQADLVSTSKLTQSSRGAENGRSSLLLCCSA